MHYQQLPHFTVYTLRYTYNTMYNNQINMYSIYFTPIRLTLHYGSKQPQDLSINRNWM